MGNQSMIKQIAFLAGTVILTSNLAHAGEAAHVPLQTINVRTQSDSALSGTIRDGEYAGVEFVAVPDASLPLDAAYQPENLLKKLDPSLVIERLDGEAMVLPTTAYRLESLTSADGMRGRKLGASAIPVYVTGYITKPSRPGTLDDLLNSRKDEKHVYVSDYIIKIADLPPCDVTRLCGTHR